MSFCIILLWQDMDVGEKADIHFCIKKAMEELTPPLAQMGVICLPRTLWTTKDRGIGSFLGVNQGFDPQPYGKAGDFANLTTFLSC